MKEIKRIKDTYYTYWLFGTLMFLGIIFGLLWIFTLLWGAAFSVFGIQFLADFLGGLAVSINHYSITIGTVLIIFLFPFALTADLIVFIARLNKTL